MNLKLFFNKNYNIMIKILPNTLEISFKARERNILRKKGLATEINKSLN